MINVKDVSYLKKFGANLREIRVNRYLSQEQLANDADIPINQIGRIERGEINCTICTVRQIAKALKIEISMLFDFE